MLFEYKIKKFVLINGMKCKCWRKLDIKYLDDVLFNFG